MRTFCQYCQRHYCTHFKNYVRCLSGRAYRNLWFLKVTIAAAPLDILRNNPCTTLSRCHRAQEFHELEMNTSHPKNAQHSSGCATHSASRGIAEKYTGNESNGFLEYALNKAFGCCCNNCGHSLTISKHLNLSTFGKVTATIDRQWSKLLQRSAFFKWTLFVAQTRDGHIFW